LRAWFAPFAGLTLMAAIGWSSIDVSPVVNPPIRHVRVEDSSVVSQLQTSASGYLWTYTEVYLHNGIKLRRQTEQEKRANGLNDGREHGITVIPGADKDFRGVFGDVERSVNAWSGDENHRQNDPRLCLPLFRLMTWLDPDFVEAWTTGAMVIGMDRSKSSTNRAIAFLREGFKHNPDCVDIPMMFGMFEITRNHDTERSIRFFKKAVENGRARLDSLSDNEKLALQNAYRWLALAYRNAGQIRNLHEATMEGLRYFPDDRVMPSTDRITVLAPKGYAPPKGLRLRTH